LLHNISIWSWSSLHKTHLVSFQTISESIVPFTSKCEHVSSCLAHFCHRFLSLNGLFTESSSSTRQHGIFSKLCDISHDKRNSQIRLFEGDSIALQRREMLLERFKITHCWISLITWLNLHCWWATTILSWPWSWRERFANFPPPFVNFVQGLLSFQTFEVGKILNISRFKQSTSCWNNPKCHFLHPEGFPSSFFFYTISWNDLSVSSRNLMVIKTISQNSGSCSIPQCAC